MKLTELKSMSELQCIPWSHEAERILTFQPLCADCNPWLLDFFFLNIKTDD